MKTTLIMVGKTTNKMYSEAIDDYCRRIGGPYGFAPSVYDRADGKMSLSRMTFSHQMVRLVFVEQVYRACTIIKNEPYHHE